MRTLTPVLLILLAGCSGGVSLTDATAPTVPGPRGGPAPEPRDAGSDALPPDAGPDAGPDGGPITGDPQPSPPPPPEKVSIFPPDSPWNTRIDDAPVDPNSDAYIAEMGADDPLTAAWDADGNGIPYVEVGADQPMVRVSYWGWPEESDPGPFPIPWDARPDPSLDRHVIVVDRERGFLYELFQGSRNSDGSWDACNGAKWNLRSSASRPLRWTSADAAGLPVFPGLVRWDEVDSGYIGHALRFVVGHSQKGFVSPATHAAGSCSLGSDCPPMGLRVRLKEDVDISGFSWRMQVILRALKQYGMFVADNGGGTSFWLSGAPDSRFSNEETRSLGAIKGRDFEVVKHGPISPQ
ncbi:MAG: hypothetical protein EHM78_18785 [Myxococcaceae bacterium]|nr:MAG: hypothetical protein EHM78_18785 [Myxococcaceae bacterium]